MAIDGLAALNELLSSNPGREAGSRAFGTGRPHGVIRRTEEYRDGKLFTVEIHAPESFPPAKRGRGKIGSYAKPKMRTVFGSGAGSGLWTGSQGDTTLLNCVLRHNVRATKWARKHGDLFDAPWHVIGKTNLFRAVRAARDFESENCPVYEQAHVLDDLAEDLERLAREAAGDE